MLALILMLDGQIQKDLLFITSTVLIMEAGVVVESVKRGSRVREIGSLCFSALRYHNDKSRQVLVTDIGNAGHLLDVSVLPDLQDISPSNCVLGINKIGNGLASCQDNVTE